MSTEAPDRKDTNQKKKRASRAARVPMDHPVRNGRTKPGKRSDLAAEICGELTSLRAALDEMTEHYRLRLGAQIGELLLLVQGDTGAGDKPQLPPARTLEPLLEHLRNARIKPRKGRPKDFIRLQELLDELTSLTPPGG